MKQLFTTISAIVFVAVSNFAQAQFLAWQHFTDSIPTLSSPRACDLNNDGIQDIVIGGGTDGFFSNSGVMAINGANGSLLWKRTSRNEVFGSAIFQDVNNDNIKDVFIVGRSAQLLCINGSNGQLLWDYFPYGTNPVDSGLYNFYNPQFIDDVSGDNVPDILVSNGGDHAAPAWQSNRPAGRLMIVNAVTGSKIAQATVLDSAEIYCSPIVVDLRNDGSKWILYGTGGENFGGSFWACPLNNLLQNSLNQSVALLSDNAKGFIAPASVFQQRDSTYDIYVQSFSGKVSKINGLDFSIQWTNFIPNTESSAAPVIGNFTGSLTPDVMSVVYKGSTLNGYSDYYQMILDGDDGTIVFKDSIGSLHFASGNAIDLNNDGRDEGVITVTQMNNGVFRHKLFSIDLQNNLVQQISSTEAGVNLGSTPLITDLNGDNRLEMIYAYRKDSINPSGWKGIYVNRYDLNIQKPNAGIAWGSYMGTNQDGIYNYGALPCGTGSVLNPATIVNPSCNGFSDGSLYLNPVNSSISHTFLWSHGSTSSILTGMPAGTYSVRAVNTLGCYEDVVYNLRDPFVISYGAIQPVACLYDNNGAAIVGSSGCQCQFSTCTFLWDNGVTTKPNTSLSGGWNSITITHMNGCVVVDSVFIPSTDATPPSITAPADIIVNAAPGSCYPSSISLGSALVSDSCGVLSIINDAPTQFSVGTTTIRWTATDLNNNSSVAIQQVTVIDNEAPVISNCPLSLSIPANFNNCSAVVSWNSVQVTDNCSYTQLVSSHISGDTFPLGVTNVCLIAIDSSGNRDSCSFDVEVYNSLSLLMDSSQIIQGNDGAASVVVSGGSGNYSYQWSGPQGFSSSAQNISNLSLPGFYYLTVTDVNGCTAFSQVQLVAMTGTEKFEKEKVVVYPNPVSNLLQINNPNTELLRYELSDVLGRTLLNGENQEAHFKLNMSQLLTGTYLLKIVSTISGEKQTFKIIKE